MASDKNMSEISNSDTDIIFVPKSISDVLAEISMIRDLPTKSSKFDFYIHLLEEELRKVDAFKRELPYCMQLLQDGISTLRKECVRVKEREEAGVVVTEELIVIPRVESSDVHNKKTWMSRVRLWTVPVGNDSFPFKCEEDVQKKQRRCWSPHLHNLFVHALLQLGGPYVATPKQIRELMKVDGLTNDEVKSHLQKYRLHMKKVPGSSAGITDASTMVAHSGSADEDDVLINPNP